jgi:hypothetical protein
MTLMPSYKRVAKDLYGTVKAGWVHCDKWPQFCVSQGTVLNSNQKCVCVPVCPCVCVSVCLCVCVSLSLWQFALEGLVELRMGVELRVRVELRMGVEPYMLVAGLKLPDM